MACFENLGIFIERGVNFKLSDYIEDSLSFISLIVEIEERFGIEIEDKYLNMDILENFESVVSLIKHIHIDNQEELYT